MLERNDFEHPFYAVLGQIPVELIPSIRAEIETVQIMSDSEAGQCVSSDGGLGEPIRINPSRCSIHQDLVLDIASQILMVCVKRFFG